MRCDFGGKTALVTGAAGGIGRACAKALAASGAEHLVLVDRDRERLARLDLSCSVERFVGDVGDPALWNRVESSGYALDLAVCNAGIAAGGAIAEMDFEHWRQVMAVNLDGAFLSLRSAMRLARDGAALVLVASINGVKAEPGTAAYGASKAGVIQLAKVAAKEGAARRIRVNAIAPGGVDTAIWDGQPFFRELVAQHDGDRAAAMAALAGMATPLGRYAQAEEIAAQILFLLSDAAATITGSVLVSDSGYSL